MKQQVELAMNFTKDTKRCPSITQGVSGSKVIALLLTSVRTTILS